MAAGAVVRAESLTQGLLFLEDASLIRAGEAGGDLEYHFKHSLIQETAYGTLLRERRMALHQHVAEAILRLNPEAGVHQPAVLAFHYYRAGDAERAFRFALTAGDQARRNYAHQEAIANYDLALSVADRLKGAEFGPQIRAAFRGKGSALEISGEHLAAQDAFRAMRSFAAAKGDAAMEAEALNQLATSADVTSDPTADVEDMLQRASALARQAGDQLILARTVWNQGLRYRFKDPLRAEDYFHQALEITRSPACQALPPEAGVSEAEAFILIDLMVSGLTSGQRQTALQNGSQALASFRRLGNKAMVADALAGLATLHYAGAQFDTAITLSEEGRAIAEEIENPWGTTYNGWIRLAVAADRGEWQAVLDDGEGLLAAAQQVPFLGFRGVLNGILSGIWIELGRDDLGLKYAEDMARVWQSGDLEAEGWAAWVDGVVGRARMARGEVGAAAEVLEPLRPLPEGIIPAFQDYYYVGPPMAQLDLARSEVQRGIEFASDLINRFESEGTDRFTAEMLYWRGRLYAESGALPEAEADLRHALDLLAVTGARPLLWQIHAALADVLQRAGKQGEAEQLGAARAILDSLIEDLQDPDLRRSFLGRPDVQVRMA
jgi:tetratricopeptide (TPR) repeat protein